MKACLLPLNVLFVPQNIINGRVSQFSMDNCSMKMSVHSQCYLLRESQAELDTDLFLRIWGKEKLLICLGGLINNVNLFQERVKRSE